MLHVHRNVQSMAYAIQGDVIVSKDIKVTRVQLHHEKNFCKRNKHWLTMVSLNGPRDPLLLVSVPLLDCIQSINEF